MTKSVRPTDMPELRAELIEHYQQPAVVNWWTNRHSPPAVVIRAADGRLGGQVNPTGAQRRVLEINRLQQAELFFVSSAMTDLAVVAGKSLPTFAVEEFDIPAPNGLIIFEEPIGTDRNTDGGYGETVYIAGASWSILKDPHVGTLLWLSFYIDLHLTLDGEVAAGALTQAEARQQKAAQPRYSYTIDGAAILGLKSGLNDNSVLNLWGRTIVSAWLLSQQPLSEVTEAEANRAAKKRLARKRQEARLVRVVELRRPKTSDEQSGGESNYHHQWIVRGHWRNHWHPKLGVHRPIWIAPHIKGPEGAPLIGGEKVYAWKR